MDDILGFGGKRHRRKVKDLNIVPILDMLTTVIFFLLLSTSFIQYTQVTVPPASTSVQSPNDPPPPVAPKMFLLPAGQQAARVMLTWGGKSAGSKSAAVALAEDPKERRTKIVEKTRELATEFAAAYPKEKTLQLGMAAQMNYQDLISLMDGVRPAMPDVVLISYHEAQARGDSQPMSAASIEASIAADAKKAAAAAATAPAAEAKKQ